MKAKELLSRREAWTTGIIARDAEGHGVEATSQEAVSWCLIGALVKCYKSNQEMDYFLTESYYKALEKVDRLAAIRVNLVYNELERGMYAIAANESLPYEEVLALLNEADV